MLRIKISTELITTILTDGKVLEPHVITSGLLPGSKIVEVRGFFGGNACEGSECEVIEFLVDDGKEGIRDCCPVVKKVN